MKDFLKLINGWKTAAAAVYWPVVMQILPIWYPNGVPDQADKVVRTVGIALTIVGVGHKWYKKTQGEAQ